MIAFVAYLLLITGLIYYTGFFKLLNDTAISRKQITFLFLVKVLAVPAFYLVYERVYGSVDKFDSGKFFHDARILNGIAFTDFGTYLKILFGLQNEHTGSYDFLVLSNTLNWDNGIGEDYLYNDNRVVIRIHSLIHFIAFDSYFVHGLFNCLLSFIGMVYLLKTFKSFFNGNELLVLLTLCFFPSVWFYTGAPLKEGITFFLLGLLLFQTKKTLSGINIAQNMILLLVQLWCACLLKPYVLIYAFVCFVIFYHLHNTSSVKKKFSVFVLIVFSFGILLNTVSILIKNTSLVEVAFKRQHTFSEASKGGLLLSDNERFIQLPYDTLLIKKVKHKDGYYTLKEGIEYRYRTADSVNDTLTSAINKDTIHVYKLLDKVVASKSNLEVPEHSVSKLKATIYYLYYTLYYPFFFNAKSALQWMASLENMLIVLAQLVICIGFFRNKKSHFLPLVFLFFALSECLMVGITTPNSGAIFRYRGPAVLFMLLAAIYYLEPLKMYVRKRFE